MFEETAVCGGALVQLCQKEQVQNAKEDEKSDELLCEILRSSNEAEGRMKWGAIAIQAIHLLVIEG
jgi:hypothetical protein